MAARRTTKKTATKTQTAAKTARKEAVARDVAELAADKVAASIAKSGTDIQKTLASINESAQEEIAKLNTIREAISFKEEELQELHGKEAVLKSIDELQLEAENSKIDFESQAEERREAWAKEQREHDQTVADRNAQLARNRQKEEDEYSYQLAQDRKASDNSWNEQVYARKQSEQRRIDALQLEWADKEAELTKREQAIADKEDLINNFDARIAEAQEDAATKAKASVYAETNIKSQLAKKDAESSQALFEQKIATLEATVADYRSQIDTLERQNATNRDKIQTMAEEALRASSGRQALEAVQQTVEKSGNGKR